MIDLDILGKTVAIAVEMPPGRLAPGGLQAADYSRQQFRRRVHHSPSRNLPTNRPPRDLCQYNVQGAHACPMLVQVGIEPPDQAALEIDGAALRVAQLLWVLDEPFDSHPTQRVVADLELIFPVEDDHVVTQQILVAYRPQQCIERPACHQSTWHQIVTSSNLPATSATACRSIREVMESSIVSF